MPPAGGIDQGLDVTHGAGNFPYGPWICVPATAPGSGSFEEDNPMNNLAGITYMWFGLIFVQIPAVVAPASGVITIDGYAEIMLPDAAAA
jgi:hypothetical protein